MECDPKRQRRKRIAEIVQGIRQKGHAAEQRDNNHLKNRRDHQADKRPLDGPLAPRGGRNTGVDH
jgi:hypothetical protein